MSYHIYTTKGLVLSSRGVGEADRIYSILTRDLGLIRARATAVRKAASKLRGALEPFSLTSVSLVRGKDYWRLTSAELIKKIPKRETLARPLALLEKLVQGEAPHPELLNAIEENFDSTESKLVSHILYHLGYLKNTDLDLPEKELIKAINDGLKHSHLT
ncbi:MAG TPA: recombination protein O N-terminal domain-containing protein [Candidatus Paceibacterota bacterium]